MGLPGECPGRGSQTLTWVGQVDLLRGSTGILWDPLDSQGEQQKQAAAGPAGKRGAHGGGGRGREGEGMGAGVDPIPSGTVGGTGRMKTGRGSGSVTGSEAGWKGGLQGDGYPDAGEQTKG